MGHLIGARASLPLRWPAANKSVILPRNEGVRFGGRLPYFGPILLDKNERYEYIVLVLEEHEKRSSI
jgi:hypothetical protein